MCVNSKAYKLCPPLKDSKTTVLSTLLSSVAQFRERTVGCGQKCLERRQHQLLESDCIEPVGSVKEFDYWNQTFQRNVLDKEVR